LTASRVIEMDEPAAATDSSGVPSAIERSPLDFADEAEASGRETAVPEMSPPEEVPSTTAPGGNQAVETVAVEPPAVRESRKMGHEGIDANAPPKSLRRDHADLRPSGSSRGGKSLAAMQLCLASNVFVSEGVPADISDPDPLSFAGAPSSPPVDVAQYFRLTYAVCVMQVSGAETLKAAFEDYKRQQDQMVEQRCAEMDARLDAMSIDFDEELYPHMLTAIACRRWVIGHGLRLATMKCAESLKMRQAFADVVSAGIAKGMSEGLKHGVEHGHAQRTIKSLEAYDPEAEAKFFRSPSVAKRFEVTFAGSAGGLKGCSYGCYNG
nr:hypothetical protein [Tanacetum cinerariifolium]